ncbi:MAG: Hpt domain-containing protein [Candidatus Accumulibacter sp.]|nr:Hpt domain-containing protein [Accumulibacter sp.]
MNAATEFDAGPLTWVKGEIDMALERATQALDRFIADPSDPAQIRFCRTHLHQVQGALTIVGLDGVTQFAEALEGLLEALETQSKPLGEAAARLARRALDAIGSYLAGLINGQPNQPMRLLPLYREIQAERGQRHNDADLFFPDLSVRPPRRGALKRLSAAETALFLKRERGRFQRGLLAYLRAPRERGGVKDMLAVVRRIEETQEARSARAFWWVAGGFLAALAEGAVKDDPDVRQLCARIDTQIRRVLEGSKNVAERLMRDTLYIIAGAASKDPAVKQIQQAYGLAALLPGGAREAAPDAPRAADSQLRDVTAALEESWNKFCAGSVSAFQAFKENAGLLPNLSAPYGPDYLRLAKNVAAAADWLSKDTAHRSETLAMEIATAILLLQNAQANYPRLGADFAHQVDVIAARILACVSGRPMPQDAEIPLLDEMSRRAQEKLLIAQVAKEIQSNLVQIEQVLDGYFRDSEKRTELAGLEKPFKQIAGALAMLRQESALAALQGCHETVRRLAAPGSVPMDGELEQLASQLSMVGFFVEAMPRGVSDFDSFARQMRVEAGGAPPAEEDEPATVEQEVVQSRRETHALLEALKEQPQDAALRAEVRHNLETLKSDADLVDDAKLGEHAKAMLNALENGAEVAPQIVEETMAALKPEKAAEAQPPSEETLQLSQASSEQIDAELLAIFLEEAKDVLNAVEASRARLKADPGDGGALTAVRRSFHTLKGSGRMVGLKDLGETAWAIEQMLNLWLRLDLAATPELNGVLDDAYAVFGAWVRELEARSGGAPDWRSLAGRADALRASVEAKQDEIPTRPPEPEEKPGAAGPLRLPAREPGEELAKAEYAPEVTDVLGMPMLGDEYPPDEPEPGEYSPEATDVLGIPISDVEPPDDEPLPPPVIQMFTPGAGRPAFAEPIEAIRLPESADAVEPDETVEFDASAELEESAEYAAPAAAESIELAEPAEAVSPGEAIEIAEYVEPPGETVEVAETVEPSPGEAIAPAEVIEAAEAATPGESVEVVEAVEIAEPVEAVEVVEVAETAEESAPGEAAETTPGETVETAAPGDVTAPGETAESTPADAVQPDGGGEILAFAEPGEEAAEIAEAVAPGETVETAAPGDAAAPGESAEPAPIEAAEPAAPAEVAEATPIEAAESTPGDAEITVIEAVKLDDGDEIVQFAEETASPGEAAPESESAPIEAASPGETAPESAPAEIVPPGEAAESTPGEVSEPAPGETPETPPAEIAEATPVEAAPEKPETPESRYGISPELFSIFSEEAGEHLQTLRRNLPVIENPAIEPTPREMYRAAHTLAGISAAVGLHPMHRLGHALEGALQRRDRAADPGNAAALETARRAIAELEAMFAALPAGGAIEVPDGLIEELDALYPPAVLAATPGETPAPPVETPAPAEAPAPAETVAPGETAESTPGETAEAAPAEAAPGEPAPEPEPAPEIEIAPAVSEPEPAPAVPEIESTPAAPEPVSAPTPEPPPPPEPSPGVPPEPATAHEEIDAQLLSIFLEEAIDLNRAIADQLRAWRANPGHAETVRVLARQLHTLKGSARMTGAMTLGEITHALETRVDEASRAGEASVEVIDGIESAFETIRQGIERLQRGEPPLPIAPAAPSPAASPGETAPGEAPPPAAPAPKEAAERPAEAEAETEAAPLLATLRVRAGVVDRLVNEAGELSIARSRIEGEMRGLKDSLLDLTENVFRLRRQLREIEIQAELQLQSRNAALADDNARVEFDPLELDRFTRFQELTRMMAESVNDVATVQHNMLKNLDDANAAIVAQARLNREVQQELLSMRMMPFDSLTDRLYRVVRRASKDLDKRANLEIKGGQVELDRGVLDKIAAPLEHMLRNAVAHGLEPRAQRLARGKPEIGEIALSLRQEGNEIVLVLADDGAGLNYARIRERAAAAGLIGADEAADEARLAQFIFAPGFSTAGELSQVAGRGIGMDVVKTEIASLGGRVEVESTPGRGTEFRLILPLTLVVAKALLIRAGSRVFAIPSSMIEQVLDFKETQMERIRKAGSAEWQSWRYPFSYLPNLLGEREATPERRRQYWILLLKSGARRIAVQVDELMGNQEIVVKNIGPQLARVIGVDGATVLGNGQVVLILNPVALSTRVAAKPAAPAAAAAASAKAATPGAKAAPEAAKAAPPPPPAPPPPAALPTVMVVDDSLTVRKITGRLMEREGYQVLLARDGVEALEQLHDAVPDVMLVDIEMPRMDGFDLTRHIRADARLHRVPVIAITSRIAEKHRNYAAEIGINHYLGKPYQEEELLRLVRGYMKARKK